MVKPSNIFVDAASGICLPLYYVVYMQKTFSGILIHLMSGEEIYLDKDSPIYAAYVEYLTAVDILWRN